MVVMVSALWFVLALMTPAGCSVPTPRKLFMDSLNLNHILRWQQGSVENSTTIQSNNSTSSGRQSYRVEYKSTYKKDEWVPQCERTSFTNCSFHDTFAMFSLYHIRVRAEAMGHFSDWISTTFKPYIDGRFGPPRITLGGWGTSMSVSLSLPQVHASFGKIDYMLKWCQASHNCTQMEQCKERETSEATTLNDLQANTDYCVVAWIIGSDNPISDQVPFHTSTALPRWVVPLVVIGSAITSFALVAVCWLICNSVFRTLHYIFPPDHPLPNALSGLTPQKGKESFCVTALDEPVNLVQEHCNRNGYKSLASSVDNLNTNSRSA
uniref:interleukin-10 receptor subunit beta-like isoform X1 n=2 Tax=Myxine glutinosa TaxID=7769 RepID=UPI00358FCACB